MSRQSIWIPARLKAETIIRASCAVWSIVLVVLLSFGVFSSARIGTMTWGPSHDIWSAAIAISQIKFGLSGELAYKEVEHAIAAEVTSKGNAWDILDDKTRALLRDPAAITRGLKRAVALRKDQITVPATDDGYVTDWCEDLGYADFYNLAFRLFGFNAYSTHFLFVAILLLSVLLFQACFIRDSLPMATLTLAVTALFLLSACPLFEDQLPSFAANRFLSTLGLIPLLHLIHGALDRRPLTVTVVGTIAIQAAILAFVTAARGSTIWCMFALAAVLIAMVLFRSRQLSWNWLTLRRLCAAWRPTDRSLTRLVITGVLAFAVIAGFNGVRHEQINERYFRDDNLPHHLFWHSAYLGLNLNPDWPKYKPYPDVPNTGDGAGFTTFAHRMQERGEPVISTTHELYADKYLRARTYETVIRSEYLSFIIRHPTYTLRLFFYYKPITLINLLRELIGSVPFDAGGLALGSILLVLALVTLAPGVGPSSYAESGVSLAIVSLSSLLPVLWAYPDVHLMGDPILGTLLGLLIILSITGVLIVRVTVRLRELRRNIEKQSAIAS